MSAQAGVPLIDSDVMRATGASSRDSGHGVDVQAGGPNGKPVVTLGSVRLGFNDVFLLLIGVQALMALIDLSRLLMEAL